jgi:hypothetical protein
MFRLRNLLYSSRRLPNFIKRSSPLCTCQTAPTTSRQEFNARLTNGPTLGDFINGTTIKHERRKREPQVTENIGYITDDDLRGNGRKGSVSLSTYFVFICSLLRNIRMPDERERHRSGAFNTTIERLCDNK